MWPLILAALAVGRLTRLVVDDTWPFGSFRRWVEGRGWLEQMTTCPWCLSGWLSLGASGAVWWRFGLPVPPLAWLACWWGAVAAYWLTEALAKAATSDPPVRLEMDDADFR